LVLGLLRSDHLVAGWLRLLGSRPGLRIWGKARPEPAWRAIEVHVTHRRDRDSRWPRGWPGTCITWTADVIAVGWDFAADVLREQASHPASRDHPVAVCGGRLADTARRLATGGASVPSATEVLAHECGHTWQVLRLGVLYWPVVGALTLFREGPRWWNHFENQASELGLFGGIVSGSVHPDLMRRLAEDR
jgi:hypothetical protein